MMMTEDEIRDRMKFCEREMKKYQKLMNKKYKIDKSNVERFEEYQESYYGFFNEINVLKMVLGEPQI